jgi:hypothetical protein
MIRRHDPLFFTLESEIYEYHLMMHVQAMMLTYIAYLIDSAAVGHIERYIIDVLSQMAIIIIT